jgi:Mg-chelatase subunit ChlD
MSELSYLEQVARGLRKPAEAVLQITAAVMAVMYLIIIDRSGSMGTPCGTADRLRAAQDATIALLDARQAQHADDSVAVIAFNHGAELVLSFTRCHGNRLRIDKAIRSIQVDGGTDLKAALAKAQKVLPPSGRVHIVMLTDGHGGNPVKVAEKLKQRGALIETIGVGNSPDEVDEDILKKTASVLNGTVLYRFLTEADELVTYFRTEVANRLMKLDPT